MVNHMLCSDDKKGHENTYQCPKAGATALASGGVDPARYFSSRSSSPVGSLAGNSQPVVPAIPSGWQESAEIPATGCPIQTHISPKATASQRASEGRPSTRLFQRPLDARTNCRGLQKEVWRFVSFQPHRQAFEGLGLELAETHYKGHRAQRTGGQTLVAGGLAPHQKKARRRRKSLVFLDESGFSLHPTRVRSWAPKGKTPVLRHRSSWPKLSAISAVSRRGRLYLMLVDGSIRSREVLRFLKHLKRHFGHGVIILWDRALIHRSKTVREFLRQSHKGLEVEFLPAYSPDLNPDEWFWNHMKNRKLANFCPNNVGDLKSAIRRSVLQIRQRPSLVRSFFHASQLSRN